MGYFFDMIFLSNHVIPWQPRDLHVLLYPFCRGEQKYIRFINALINDTTFLLDESIDALRSIRDTQKLMDDKEKWEALSEVRR